MSVAVDAGSPIIVPGFISAERNQIWFHAITHEFGTVFVQVKFQSSAIVSGAFVKIL
jgi:hypothetical protein